MDKIIIEKVISKPDKVLHLPLSFKVRRIFKKNDHIVLHIEIDNLVFNCQEVEFFVKKTNESFNYEGLSFAGSFKSGIYFYYLYYKRGL